MEKVTITKNNVNIIGEMTIAEVLQTIKVQDIKTIEQFKQLRKSYAAGDTVAYMLKKKQLLAFISAGIFYPTIHKENIQAYSRILTLDFDHLGKDMERVREAICSDEHTLSCFASPSNDGLKALVKANTDASKHEVAWRQVYKHYTEITGVAADITGSNINRLCYASYDPDLYFNEMAKTFEVDLWWAAQEQDLFPKGFEPFL